MKNKVELASSGAERCMDDFIDRLLDREDKDETN